MPELTLTSVDPVRMYWRMVFCGVAEPDSELIVSSKDDGTGIHILSLKMN